MSKSALGFLVLVANSAYLLARSDPTLFYFANVLLHLVLGTALAVSLVLRHRRTLASWPRLLKLAAPLLLAAAVSGGALAVMGATRAHAWLLWTHIGSAAAGAVLVLAWMARPGSHVSGLRLQTAGVIAAGVAMIAAGVAVPVQKRQPSPYR